MKLCVLTIGLSFLFSACGALTSNGNIGGRDVTLDGTGLAWLDETEYLPTNAAPELVRRSNDRVELNLLFTGSIFNPDDLVFRSEREDIVSEVLKNDRFLVQVARGDRLAVGDEMSFDNNDPVIARVRPYIVGASLALGEEERLDEYPDTPLVPGSNQTTLLSIARFDTRISGKITFTLEAENGSEEGGELEVRFDVPRVGERVGECAFAQSAAGIVDPCSTL